MWRDDNVNAMPPVVRWPLKTVFVLESVTMTPGILGMFSMIWLCAWFVPTFVSIGIDNLGVKLYTPLTSASEWATVHHAMQVLNAVRTGPPIPSSTVVVITTNQHHHRHTVSQVLMRMSQATSKPISAIVMFILYYKLQWILQIFKPGETDDDVDTTFIAFISLVAQMAMLICLTINLSW